MRLTCESHFHRRPMLFRTGRSCAHDTLCEADFLKAHRVHGERHNAILRSDLTELATSSSRAKSGTTTHDTDKKNWCFALTCLHPITSGERGNGR
jgi:hypothetical protein